MTDTSALDPVRKVRYLKRGIVDMPGVEKTMHEFKRGSLRSGSGKKVTSRKQAIAIGMSQDRKKKRKGRRHTIGDALGKKLGT